MKIQEIYEVNIFLDALDVLNTPGTMFTRCEIFESISNPLPTCELEVLVPVGWVDERAIADGTPIKIKIEAKDLKILEEYNFRLFNIRKLRADQQFVKLILEGILDVYQGFTDGNPCNMYGTTSEVFKAIATKLNVASSIDNTTDSQLWTAGNNNIFNFLMYIAEFGYIDETSAMIWFFNRHKQLFYKNLTQLFRNRHENIHTFVQNPDPKKDKQFAYTNIETSIQAGIENLKHEGYGGIDFYFDQPSYSYKQVAARKVVAESNVINISKELSQGLGQEWYPFDIGNFHPNYWLAYKQNKRILSTYSTYVTLTCQFFQKFNIGQIVNIDYLDSQDLDNRIKCFTGTYIIDAIHISITLDNIIAIVETAMQGFNGKVITGEVY